MLFFNSLRLCVLKSVTRNRCAIIFRQTSNSSCETSGADEEFRVLELYPMKKMEKKSGRRSRFTDFIQPPREKNMSADQDWPSVWPTAKCFRPSVVPLPIYQGYDQKRAPPHKYANAELMKIPNFLHLTPLAIKRHCEAIKKFCNEFPAALKTDEDCDEHFPVEIISSDYCHSAPVILDERSRIVTLKVKLSSLNLDYHGRDKLIRLAGSERYNKFTDMLTIVADRCPLRKQNYDYLIYLLTALHHESSVKELWEHEKTEADMEKFFFEDSRIEKCAIKTLVKVKSSSVESSDKAISEDDVKKSKEITEYGENVTALINEGESSKNMLNYKDSVLRILNLKSNKSVCDTL